MSKALSVDLLIFAHVFLPPSQPERRTGKLPSALASVRPA